MPRRDEGYTLVELVVVMAIFSIVTTLISVSFSKIVASSGQIVKSTETDIGGLIGLEVLRCDLEFAGFGLPWSTGGASYSGEVGSGVNLVSGNPDTGAAQFNDDYQSPPRAFRMLNDKGFNRSDYLVIKGTAVGMSKTARRWSYTYLNYSSSRPIQKVNSAAEPPENGDRVIVLSSAQKEGVEVRDLVTATPGSTFSVSYSGDVGQFPQAFWPKSREDRYIIYGVSPAKSDVNNNSLPLSFPFNRADYYIDRDQDRISSICADGTGILYKSTINQNGGSPGYTKYPILDCVADLQVIFMLDSNLDGEMDLPLNDLSGLGASDLREQVKEVRVYILAQQGKKDPTYSYPVSDPGNVFVLGDAANGRVWRESDLIAEIGGDWMHYHWKIYTIVVQPKNLQ